LTHPDSLAFPLSFFPSSIIFYFSFCIFILLFSCNPNKERISEHHDQLGKRENSERSGKQKCFNRKRRKKNQRKKKKKIPFLLSPLFIGRRRL
jgi:hypothetical protein